MKWEEIKQYPHRNIKQKPSSSGLLKCVVYYQLICFPELNFFEWNIAISLAFLRQAMKNYLNTEKNVKLQNAKGRCDEFKIQTSTSHVN